MSRRAVGTVVVGSWVVCVGWLAVRQIGGPPEAFLEAASTRLAPGGAFYQIVVSGTPIGNAGITLDTTFTGYRLTEVWNMDLPAAGGRTSHVSRVEGELTRSLRLQGQTVTMSEAGEPRQIEFVRRPGNGDTVLAMLVRTGGASPEMAGVIAESGVTTPAALSFRLAAERRLGPGRSLEQRAVSPLTGGVESHTVRVVGDTVLAVADSAVWDSAGARWVPVPAPAATAWRLERRAAGQPIRELVDGQGRLIRREWAFGVTLERTPFEVNYTMYQAGLRTGALRLPPRLPGAVIRAALPGRPDPRPSRVVVRLGRTDGPAWPGAVEALAGGRQTVSGDTVVIWRDGPGPEVPPTEAERQLRSVRSQPVLRAWQEALASLPADADTLDQLVRWVHSAVRLVTTGGGEVTATAAARHRAAAPEGMVRLLVELARRAGMPARAVSGVDVSRLELPAHTWAEVWRGDRWHAVDPTFGQTPASASLLRVTAGAVARPLGLVPMVGSLSATLVAEDR